MVSTIQEPSKSLSDRISIQRAPRNECDFGFAMREELDELKERVAIALRHADDLGRHAPGMCSIDMQRDVLHLQARMACLGHQIEDARESLERMRRRAASDQRLRRSAPEPLPARLRDDRLFETVAQIASINSVGS